MRYEGVSDGGAPVAQWKPVFHVLSVQSLEFADPSARITPGNSRSDAYWWRAVLVSKTGRYAVQIEPFGCAVTDLNKF